MVLSAPTPKSGPSGDGFKGIAFNRPVFYSVIAINNISKRLENQLNYSMISWYSFKCKLD